MPSRRDERVREVLVHVVGSSFVLYPSTRLCADLGLDSLDIEELEIELAIEFGGRFQLNVAKGKRDMTYGELLYLVEHGPT